MKQQKAEKTIPLRALVRSTGRITREVHYTKEPVRVTEHGRRFVKIVADDEQPEKANQKQS